MSINKGASTRHNRDYRLSQLGKDYAEAAAEAVVRTALEETGLSEADLKILPGSDRRKVEIAALLQKETTVSQSWIAEIGVERGNRGRENIFVLPDRSSVEGSEMRRSSDSMRV